MAEVPFVTLDVFTETRFGGNPLAVVTDARGLDDRTMQRLAAEFGYSETTFVLPPQDPANTARVRIFTPTEEVPFAGHPNVGTGFVLARDGLFGRTLSGAMRFEETAGLVEVEPLREAGEVVGARVEAPRPCSVGPVVAPGLVAAALGVPVDALVDAPCVASVGLPFVFAELRDLAALAACVPDLTGFRELESVLRPAGASSDLMVFVRTGPGRVRARMFAPLHGVMEDPATGSASAALGGLLASRGEGARLLVEQGFEMGRPSRIEVEVDEAGRVRIAGSCVPVMQGTLRLS